MGPILLLAEAEKDALQGMVLAQRLLGCWPKGPRGQLHQNMKGRKKAWFLHL